MRMPEHLPAKGFRCSLVRPMSCSPIDVRASRTHVESVHCGVFQESVEVSRTLAGGPPAIGHEEANKPANGHQDADDASFAWLGRGESPEVTQLDVSAQPQNPNAAPSDGKGRAPYERWKSCTELIHPDGGYSVSDIQTMLERPQNIRLAEFFQHTRRRCCQVQRRQALDLVDQDEDGW
jgi:hypothetical protein